MSRSMAQHSDAYESRSAIAQWWSAQLEIEGYESHWRYCEVSKKPLYLLSIGSTQDTSQHD